MNDLFKKWHKLILLIIPLLTLPLAIFVQFALTFSVSPLYSMPVGSSAVNYQYGFGGNRILWQ